MKFDERSMTPDARAALEKAGFSRRGFLARTGALIVGFNVAGGARRAAAAANASPRDVALDQIDSWVAIARDESITAYTGKCDFGQGFKTVQFQLIAEELDVPMDRVTLVMCDTSITPDQGVTSGSQSHLAEFGPAGLRQALATARDALVRMAAAKLNAPMDQLVVSSGAIAMKTDSSQQVTYGSLIGGQQFHLGINTAVAPKSPRDYKVLGTSVPRQDIPLKITAKYQYAQTVRLPGMLHGKVVRPPVLGAKVVRVDQSSIQGMAGNPRVVVKNDFVGIVADRQYEALLAAQALNVTWSDGVTLPDFQDVYNWMRTQPSSDSLTVAASDVDQKIAGATKTVSATYHYPYQMHGSLASSCAVADVKGSGANTTATIWSSTQGVYPQRDSVALVLGTAKENVRVIYVEGSGCYGLNGADSVSYDAAIMSQAVGKPVRVQYTRSDEMRWGESYGPAAVMDLKAGLDNKGQIVAWNFLSYTLTKGNRPNATTPGNILSGALAGFPTPPTTPRAATPPTTYSNNSNAASSYGAGLVAGKPGGTGIVTSERVLTKTIASPFFTGPLRSPNRIQNTFANESFIDEVAAAAQSDAVDYRLRHLSDPRLMAVLNAAAQKANWDKRPSPKVGNPKRGVAAGRGVSCALYEGNNGYSAMVAEVEVDQESGVITVKRFTVAQDSGPVSNPDGLRNQMEGGAMQGLSRALYEEVKWTDQTVTGSDWRRYPVYHFGQPIPVIQTVLMNPLDQPQLGAGECAITIVAAAIANAVFDATGARLREVPFTPPRVLAALATRRGVPHAPKH